MSKGNGEVVSVRILPNESGNPKGKLADAEVIFGADSGPLSGLRLIGFGVWERRDGGRNVTFPARQYSVNGERRSFALLRPANGGRQRAGRDSAVHPRRVHPHRGRLLNGPLVLSQAAGPSAPPPGGHGFIRPAPRLWGHSWTRPYIPAPIAATPERLCAPCRSSRSLTVQAHYELTEAGRKASLLAGGDGRTRQELTIQVPVTRLHLVSVDDAGVARLKLQPRFERGEDRTVIRRDGVLRFDVPPSHRRSVSRGRPQLRARAPLSRRAPCIEEPSPRRRSGTPSSSGGRAS